MKSNGRARLDPAPPARLPLADGGRPHVVKELAGKTAVVTGAASGIGRALAAAFAAEGMRVVLADVEAAALDEAAHAVAPTGTGAIAVPTDVSKGDQVDALAVAAERAFGAVHLVCNNAGVAVSGLSWMHTLADWEWVLGVNLWGVIHGVRAFLPRLLTNGTDGHMVNTASMAGLLSAPGMAVYDVSKHGVVTLTESLYHELRLLGAPVGVSVVCPGAVATRIMDSGRNRPAHLADTAPALPGEEGMREAARASLAAGLPPARVATLVLDAVRTGRFWVLPHPEWKRYVRVRLEDVLGDRNPSSEAFEGLANPGTPTS
jgi:NAD(P)-dependent dehydrogenase (short-subunit alcohol dehydrogenase family)